jgi:cysteinyl-tRNA synthetase
MEEALAKDAASGDRAVIMEPPGVELREKAQQLIPRFREAMDDDFNTAQALGVMFESVRAVNRLLAEIKEVDDSARAILSQVHHVFVEIGGVLGLFGNRPAEWLDMIKAAKAGRIDISPEEIERLIQERGEARRQKNFKRSDEIRDLLLEKGIQLLDSAQGTTWKMK